METHPWPVNPVRVKCQWKRAAFSDDSGVSRTAVSIARKTLHPCGFRSTTRASCTKHSTLRVSPTPGFVGFEGDDGKRRSVIRL